jgi:threonine aldolase
MFGRMPVPNRVTTDVTMIEPSESRRASVRQSSLGGSVRQTSLSAVCGRVALEQLVDRSAGDHFNACRLAEGPQVIDPTRVDIDSVVTNIVMLHTENLRRCAQV